MNTHSAYVCCVIITKVNAKANYSPKSDAINTFKKVTKALKYGPQLTNNDCMKYINRHQLENENYICNNHCSKRYMYLWCTSLKHVIYSTNKSISCCPSSRGGTSTWPAQSTWGPDTFWWPCGISALHHAHSYQAQGHSWCNLCLQHMSILVCQWNASGGGRGEI